MKRSVRHGIAIAGMAGGFWLLGQAVASAEAPANTADASAILTSATPAGTGGGSADSDNSQHVTAKNEVSNTAQSGPIDVSGGTSTVSVNAGNGNSVEASSGKGAVDAKQNVTTVVWISSEANGGTVSGSNNASAGNGASNHAAASGTLNSSTTGGSGKNAGKAESENNQRITAKNDISNDASTGDIYANGGTSTVTVNAGNGNSVEASNCHASLVWTLSLDGKCKDGDKKDGDKKHEHESGNVSASQTVNTSVTINSEANGGKVSDSNNSSAGNGGNNSASASGVLNSNTTGGSSQKGKDEDKGKGDTETHTKGGNAESDNHQDVKAVNDVDNTATTGDINAGGGTSTVTVNAGNNNTLYCTSKTGNVTCSQNISTIINIISQANGGSVSCSNNASAGNAGSAVCPVTNNTSNNGSAQAAPAAHKAVAPAAKKASASASAQPHGTLAFTGAETSLPLTLGLLALGAGGALTLAGRRRETTTV